MYVETKEVIDYAWTFWKYFDQQNEVKDYARLYVRFSPNSSMIWSVLLSQKIKFH